MNHHEDTKDTKDVTREVSGTGTGQGCIAELPGAVMNHHEDTKDTKDRRERANELSNRVIGAAIEVHRALGPGLLESTYEECLVHEFVLQEIPFQRQVPLPIVYKGVLLECGYRLDLLVDELVLLELKAIERRLMPIHEAQVLTYLRLKNLWLGLLINFNVPVLRDGVRRLVNG
jgi:GxxExxY protein